MPSVRAHEHSCDVLIIGTGVAGLLTALKASSLGSVILVTKRQAMDATRIDG